MKIKSAKNTFGTAILYVFVAFLTSACSGSSGGDPFSHSRPGTTIPVGNTGGSSPVNEIPIAVADEVITDTDPITLNILSNDLGLGDIPLTISIPGLPAFGNLTVEADNSVTFTPNSSYIGNDSFTYVVTDNNGDSASATVFLDIRCPNCQPNQPNTSLTLRWDANPDDIEGYIVSYGSTANTVNKTASSLYTNSSEFNANNPSVQFDVTTDLNLIEGNSVCFTLKAFNTVGQSAPSVPVCTVI